MIRRVDAATLIIVLATCILFGSLLGASKGRGGDGFLLGLFLGPLGVIIAALLPRSAGEEAKHQAQIAKAAAELPGAPTRACPWCAEQIQPAAVVCKHCGRDVAPVG